MFDLELWLGNLAMGTGVGVLVYSCGEHFASAFGLVEQDLAEKLRRLRASTANLRKYLVAWLVAIAAVFFGLWIGLGNLVFGILFSTFLICGPWYLLRRMAEARRQKIEDQLADAIVTLSGAIKAGLSLAQSLEILADQCPKPICTEFQQIVGEYKLGKPLDRTLHEAKERLKSENFALFAAALEASRESGGRLNETVERIATSVLEFQRLERKVASETAQARKSAVYMALAPAFILVVYYFVDPINTVLLFTTLVGQLMLAVSVVLNLIAYLWARAILNPDI
ncbi:MAG: type II secretion system F family protein [Pirellulales bacterium]